MAGRRYEKSRAVVEAARRGAQERYDQQAMASFGLVGTRRWSTVHRRETREEQAKVKFGTATDEGKLSRVEKDRSRDQCHEAHVGTEAERARVV
jgi:hypothetical protein